MTWRGEIMALPEVERLPAALDLITDLFGGGTADRTHWRAVLGIPPQQSLLFAMFYARPGQLVAVDAILLALDFEDYAATEAGVRVQVSNLRGALARAGVPDAITTGWGMGYALTQQAANALRPLAPPPPPSRAAVVRSMGNLEPAGLDRQGCPWTPQDDADLEMMIDKGDSLDVIAFELERTQRAVLDRQRALGLPVLSAKCK